MPQLPISDVRQRLGDPTLEIVIGAQVAAWLPTEPYDGHKGTFGSALVVAGSINYTGAAYLAAGAAYRAGAGLVTAAVPGEIHSVIATLLPEATFLPLSEDLGVIARPAAAVVRDAWGRYQAILVGPGLTTQRPATEFMAALLAAVQAHGPEPTGGIGFDASIHPQAPERDASSEPTAAPTHWVVDADGLNLLADMGDGLRRLPGSTVLTPHPGEMARLIGKTTAEVNADRVGVARRAAADWGHVVVLKGALTVIAAPDGRVLVNPFANPALATAGSGDVLSGTVTGLLAQGMDPFEAAASAAYVHGMAGEMAAEAVGRRGVTAGDVLARIAPALDSVER